MAQRHAIIAEYTISLKFKIPKHISKDDIKEYYVKWDTLFLTLKDDTELEVEINDVDEALHCQFESGALKRPSNTYYASDDSDSDEEEQEDDK